MPAFTNIIECKDCGATFQNWSGLYRHQRVFHSDGQPEYHVCDCCGKIFLRRDNLKRHMKTHTTQEMNEQFMCEKCDMVFSRKSNLRRHEQSVHPTNSFICEICEKEFSRKDNYVRHKKIHEKDAQHTDQPVHEKSSSPDVTSPFDGHAEDQLPTMDDIYQQHKKLIQTHSRVSNKVRHLFNFELLSSDPEEIRQYAEEVFDRQKTAFKVNVAFGFILRNNETQVLRYHYASTNGRLFDAPRQILNRNSFDAFVKELEMADYLEYARQQRPNSKWVVDRITNISFYVYPLREYPIGCQSDQDLPDFIARNKSILNHPSLNLTNDNTNLCFFRCLATHLHGKKRWIEKMSLKYFRQYTSESPKSFRGVKLSELDGLEKLFNVNIVVYELIKEESVNGGEKGKVVAQLVRRSINKFADTMYLNIYKNHFSYIADINRYCKRYECRKCKKLWKTAGRLNRHESKCEGSGVRKVYPGGVYVTPPTVFEDLESEGIHVPNHDRYFPFFAVYDYESILQGLTGTSRTEKMEMINEHIPVSVSIASNVPGYESPQCFISDGNATNLVSTMVTYLHEISNTSCAILEDRYTPVFQEIENRISNMKKMASSTAQEEKTIPKVTFLTKLKYRLKAFAKELPVVGFNSGKYDVNIVKKFLYPVLLSSDPILFIVKRNNNHMAIRTEHLNFLDILNYLAPGFSYNLFLKAYKCSQTKGFFPYEWLNSLEKLDHPRLPPHEAFFSKLKMENISDEDYLYCQRVWEENRMMTMRDFLTWYNNRDVQPFVEAVEKMTDFYRERGIDMFKDGISVPGLTLKYLMKTVPFSTNFSLVHERDADLFQTMKKNLIGGPSIVFTRYHEKGESRIRGGKLCQKIIGYDANALYLWAIMQEMPTGHYVRRKSEKQFRPQTKLPMAAEWLEYESYRNGVAIRHAGNNIKKRVGPRNVPVDGFCSQTNTVYQFHGCWWHGHYYQLNEGKKFNEKRKRSMADLYQETRDTSAYIKQCGYNLVEMWECDYRKKRMTDEILKEFLNRYQRPLHKTWKMTEKEILQAVMGDKLFGIVECDIHVPDDLKDIFSEMCPIFKNATITRDDIGNFMKSFAERHGIMKAPRRNLIGSMFGDQVMIITPLLKWYIQHGLVVSKIHQVVEYTPQRCFLHFGQAVSDARRAGDLDKDKAIIADTMKLIGNSSYGKTITNKDKHRLIKICDFVDAAKYVRDINFRDIDSVTEDCYEVEMSKKTIKEDLPIQIGLFVYQYAKMRMLEFYYDFLLKYVDRADFEMCEMDTDSAYMAISSDTLEEIIKPDRREAYYQDKFNWFPRDDTPANARYDKRTPGLFIVEWEGDGIVALCSKTYYCFGSKDKFSCKGINKKQNDITKSLYLDVLTSGESASRKNTGFIVKKNTVFTYNQIREGFTNFYPKRKVLDDGVSTTYLDI